MLPFCLFHFCFHLSWTYRGGCFYLFLCNMLLPVSQSNCFQIWSSTTSSTSTSSTTVPPVPAEVPQYHLYQYQHHQYHRGTEVAELLSPGLISLISFDGIPAVKSPDLVRHSPGQQYTSTSLNQWHRFINTKYKYTIYTNTKYKYTIYTNTKRHNRKSPR